jgi:hypothetical protein
MSDPALRVSPTPAQTHRRILAAALRRILRPLVRVLLRSGIPYGLFVDIAKQAYVEVASDEFEIPGRKQTVSRVAIITGLTRKEIARIKELQEADAAEVADRYNRAARVISGWLRDPRFSQDGEPKPLPVEGEGATFTGLVKEFSGDVPPRAILDELIDARTVEMRDDGYVQLVTRAYIPRDSKADKLGILGADVSQLIDTISHNVYEEDSEPRFQRKVSYDNLPAEALKELRTMSASESQALLEKLDRWLAAHDRDANPQVDGSGRKRAGVGIYYFEEDFDPETDE